MAASAADGGIVHVGVMRLSLTVSGARSLKDKRQVVRSFKERVKSRIGVSIAEIGHQDKIQRATFGVAVVSADAGVCEELLGKVISMASTLPDAILSDHAIEIVPFGASGDGVRGGIESVVAVDPEDEDEGRR
jgi:uncharacterized protein YlxP (DUF503 family)